MPTARDIALKTLLTWTNLNDPPFLPERTDAFWEKLSPRDRAVAFDLLTGIIRWRGTLDTVISARLSQQIETLDHPLHAILWLGVYQLLFHGGTADYAAVDTTVELAKKHPATARAAGLINAVLRNITRMEPKFTTRELKTPLSRQSFATDFSNQITFNAGVFPNPEAAPDGHLAKARSHPVAFVTHMRKIYGEEVTANLLLRNNIRPVITLRADTDAFDAPASAGLLAHGEVKRFVLAAQGWNPAIEELVNKGTLSPQDPTSAKPIQAAAALWKKENRTPPERILDLCAGLGTKTIQVARAFPDATVIGTDIAADKLQKLAARAKRIKQFNILTTPINIIEDKFDLVMVDVPCSNTGVFAKRVQSRWRWPMLEHTVLRNLQLKLLSQASGYLKSGGGGTILYSTCSVDPQENEKLIHQFLQQSAEANQKFRIIEEEATLPSMTPSPELTHDGGYYCILRAE